MAVTGAIFNSLIYGGINSADYGVYISGDAVFNAPQRAVELVSVPGRNGSIAIDQGHFENIEVEYPAGMFGDDKTDFRQRLSDFRNAIMSQKGYQRLSDTYHPDEYRMGMYIEGLEVEPTHYNEAGQFTLKFNCKPQRYLTSGEQLVDIEDWTDVETVSDDEGNPVEFDNDNPAKSFKSIEENFLVASQDGTPWKSEVESAPYLFRQSSGGTVDHEYDSESDAIVGGTVAWNQSVSGSNYRIDGSYGGLTSQRNVAQAYIHVSGTTTARDSFRVVDAIPLILGHKYYINLYGVSGDDCGLMVYNGPETIYGVYARVWDATSSLTNLALAFQSGVTIDADIRCDVVDITLLFGSTIADYIHSLEQTTVGSGVAKLKSWGFLDKDYYAYDAGSLQSVNVSAHETVGFNQWDEEWEVGALVGDGSVDSSLTARRTTSYIHIFPNTAYYLSNGYAVGGRYAFYDANKELIDYSIDGIRDNLFTTPIDAHYLRITLQTAYGTTYKNNVCINISSDRNGEYEPYVKHSYPLDSDLTLRGIPKLDASNNLYYDGDVYEASGEVTRKYGIVDLGTLAWDKISNTRFEAGLAIPAIGEWAKPNIVCSAYIADSYNNVWGGNVDNAIAIYSGGNYIQIRDSAKYDSMTAEQFKTAMSGVYLVYPLATETTETADPFTAIQNVSPYGTEEYVDYGVSQGTRDIAVPVGHQTRYIERIPIEGIDSITTYLGNTDSVEDATAYETEFNGTEYGGMLDVISGDFTRYFKGITYTGQDIGDTWISDCEPFVAGTLPTYGAQVVYFLSTFETDDFDGQDIDTLVGHNVLWSDPTSIILEAQYGIEPGILYNPTLFDAQPLLKAKGEGSIFIGEKEVEILDLDFGDVELIPRGSSSGWTLFNKSNFDLLNDGDTITIKSGSVFPIGVYMFDQKINSFTLTVRSSDFNCHLSSSPVQPEDSGIYYLLTIDEPITFTKNSVPATKNIAFNFSVNYGSGLVYANGIYGFIKYVESSGNYGISFLPEVDFDSEPDPDMILFGPSNAIDRKEVIGYSTKSVTGGDPIYIDCELGEAYLYNGGEPVSLNRYIDLGSDLPILKPGVTEITADDSITYLGVRPRWWKI